MAGKEHTYKSSSDFIKTLDTNDTTNKKLKVKINKGADIKVQDDQKFDDKEEIDVDAKVVKGADDAAVKDKDVEKEGTSVKAKLIYKKNMWGKYFIIKSVDGIEIKEPEKNAQVSIKGGWFFFPTWTLIGLGILAAVAILGLLVWSLFKKDGEDSEE